MKNFKLVNKGIYHSQSYLKFMPLIISSLCIYFMPSVISYKDANGVLNQAPSIIFLLYGLLSMMLPLFFSLIGDMKLYQLNDKKINIFSLISLIFSVITTGAMLTMAILIFSEVGTNMIFTGPKIAALISNIISCFMLIFSSALSCVSDDSKFYIKTFRKFESLSERFHKSLSLILGTCGLFCCILCTILMSYYSLIPLVLGIIMIVIIFYIMIYKINMFAAKRFENDKPMEEEYGKSLVEEILKEKEDK